MPGRESETRRPVYLRARKCWSNMIVFKKNETNETTEKKNFFETLTTRLTRRSERLKKGRNQNSLLRFRILFAFCTLL